MATIAQASDVTQRTRWYIHIRWFFLLALTLPGLISLYPFTGWNAEFRRDLILVIVALASNGLFYGLGRLERSDRYFKRLAVCLLLVDVLLMTALIFMKGGIESRSPILYTMPLLMSAAIFGRRGLFVATALIVGLYDSVILGNYFNFVHSPGSLTDLRSNLPYVINTICFMSAILVLIAVLANFITRLLINKEQQAYETASTLKRAQTLAKLGSWEWDLRWDKITWSDELYRIYGLPTGSLVTYDKFMEGVHPDDIKLVTRKLTQAAKHKTRFQAQYRITVPDSSIRYVVAESEVVADIHGVPTKMYGTVRDISAEKALEVAKSEFVSLASHQLRTPATAVKLLLAMLKDDYAGKLTKEQRGLFVQAYEANERQLQVVNDILSVARIETGKIILRKKSTDLTELMSSVVGQQLPQAMVRHQQISSRLPAYALMSRVDPDFLRIAVDNLLSNASKYTPDGGKITVSLRRYKGVALLSISDTGVGIARGDMPRLFQKFERIENNMTGMVEGSGLGLYITKHIVALHDGTITAHSKLGAGTIFTIRVPIVLSAKANH